MPQLSLVYVTVDGVLQPLAYSQVCRVLFGLSRRNIRYRLVTMEKPADLRNRERVAELEEELRAHGIEWAFSAYDEAGTSRSAALNLARLAQNVRHMVSSRPVTLLHARAYHSALIAAAIKRTRGIPYLFDARGRWVDERLAAGRWFKRRPVERAARAVERHLYENASGHVVLTQIHAEDITSGQFGVYNGAPLRVITTCADFASFDLTARQHVRAESAQIPAEIRARLADKLVIAFIGSNNASYLYDESFALAARILERRADAHLLILTSQQREFEDLARRAGLAGDRHTIASAAHRAMPEWLSHIDWAVQLLNSGTAKRGSMPTKLAEFFAAGVRPVHFGCNDEVSGWVRHAGSGYVLDDLRPEQLDRAADFVATSRSDAALLATARERTRQHFDLANGLDTYEALLHEVAGAIGS
jgi:hypothetical protein